MKEYNNFPYITWRRVGMYALSIIATELAIYLFSLQNKNLQNQDTWNLTLVLVPVCGLWITVTKYLTYNVWYVYRIRHSGIAYKANVLRTNKGGIDPSAPFATEVKNYNVTYVQHTPQHLFYRFIIQIGILISQVFGLVVLMLILNYFHVFSI